MIHNNIGALFLWDSILLAYDDSATYCPEQ